MKKKALLRNLPWVLICTLLVFSQCELFLGQRPEGVTVTIDLGESFATSRALQLAPEYTHCTGVKLTVFGEGMTRIENSVSPGTRYLTLTVPAGKERYFTLETFIEIDSEIFPYTHVRSFKGRAIADLEPGKIVVLKLNMVAGATDLLIPDYGNNRLYVFNSFNQAEPTGSANIYNLSDVDISAEGSIICSVYDIYSYNHSSRGNNYDSDFVPFGYPPNMSFANAIDRYANFDIDGDKEIDYNILYIVNEKDLYFCLPDKLDPPTPTTLMEDCGFIQINGLAVDPWTHRLYLVGIDPSENPCLVEYDPTYREMLMTGGYKYGRVLRTISHPNFRSLQDVIVKDEYIFVLNEITDHQKDQSTPVLLKFDRKLNYLAGFGTVSVDVENDYILKESYEPGKFYHPKRFFAHENEGLYIIDDTNLTFDKIVFINTDLEPQSWRANCPTIEENSIFAFFE